MKSSDIVMVIANIETGLNRVAEVLTQPSDMNISNKISEVMPVLHFLTLGLDQLIDDDEAGNNSVLNAVDLVRERMFDLPEEERYAFDNELRGGLAELIKAGTAVLNILGRIAVAEIKFSKAMQ